MNRDNLIEFAGVVYWLLPQPSKLMKRVRFPPPAPVFIENADMAQLVERTLGKGEVGSSNLPISTIP